MIGCKQEHLLLIINALFIAIYLWSGMSMGPIGERSVIELIEGQLAPLLWVRVILCGIIIALGISISIYFVSVAYAFLLITAVASEIVGASPLKYTLLRGALYSPLVPR